MKIKLLLIIIALFSIQSFAQDEWMRVQSDDGEFSIEVPANYSYFSDKEGTVVMNTGIEETLVSHLNPSFKIPEMEVLNAYAEHTLLSFESYKAPFNDLEKLELAKALEGTDEGLLRKQKFYPETSVIRKGGYWRKESVFDTKELFTIRVYFCSKNYIYILTASSRSGRNATMKHFFDSLIFDPETKGKRISKDTRFSTLKTTPIIFEENVKDNNLVDTNNRSSNSSITPLSIVTLPITITTGAAISFRKPSPLKLEFSDYGQISKIIVLEKLEFRLRRNVILSALRAKFLPMEKDGKPIPFTKVVEFPVH